MKRTLVVTKLTQLEAVPPKTEDERLAQCMGVAPKFRFSADFEGSLEDAIEFWNMLEQERVK